MSVCAVAAGSLVLAWDPNTEPDVVGYIVHFGTRPGTYDASFDVGPANRYEFFALEDSVRYYFAVSAYDYWNNESRLSREVSGVVGQGEIFPSDLILYSSFPNPFMKTTRLQYDLPEDGPVEIRIYDALGKLVRHLRDPYGYAGANSPILWDGKDDTGRNVPSGMYYCRAFSGNRESITVRIVRVK